MLKHNLLQCKKKSTEHRFNNISFSTSGCCYRVKVGFTRGQQGGAFKLHPYMFTYYRMEPGMINGRNHYTSEDGRFAVSYCGDSYWIQRADTRCINITYDPSNVM